MKKRTFFRIIAFLTILAGFIIGIGNEKMPMEEFYSSTKLAWGFIIIGLSIMLATGVLTHLKKYKPQKLLYPLHKKG